MTTLGKRPASNEISFDAHCFEIVGEQEIYTVSCGFGYGKTPCEFTNKEEAEKRAKETGRSVSVSKRPIYRRVRWN